MRTLALFLALLLATPAVLAGNKTARDKQHRRELREARKEKRQRAQAEKKAKRAARWAERERLAIGPEIEGVNVQLKSFGRNADGGACQRVLSVAAGGAVLAGALAADICSGDETEDDSSDYNFHPQRRKAHRKKDLMKLRHGY